MNARHMAVITLLAASLVGAAQSQAGTVNRGRSNTSGQLFAGSGVGAGTLGGSIGNALFYTSVLRAPNLIITNTVAGASVTNNYPSILGTARFQVDNTSNFALTGNTIAFNGIPSIPTAGYVNLSSGGSILSGDVVGTFTFASGNTNHIIASFMCQNIFLSKIQESALIGDFLVSISGSFDATSTNSSTFSSTDSPCQRVLMTGVDNGDSTVTYNVYNTGTNDMSSVVYKR